MPTSNDIFPLACFSPRNIFLSLIFFGSQVLHAQNCTSSQFSKSYVFFGYGKDGFFERLNNNQYVTGTVRNYESSLLVTDIDANLVWSKRYNYVGAAIYGENGNAKRDTNNNIFFDINAVALGLTDVSGNVLTMKRMDIPYTNVVVLGLGVLPDNRKIVFVDDQSTYGADGYMLFCLTADLSSILWCKHFSFWNLYFRRMTVDGNKIYIGGGSVDDGLFLCFDGNNGNLLTQKTFKADNKRTILDKIYPYNGGYMVKARYFGGAINNHLILRLDNNFNVINFYRLNNLFDNAGAAFAVEPNGDFYGAWGTPGGFGNGRFFITKNDSVIFSRYSMAAAFTSVVNLFTTDQGIISAGIGNWHNVATNTDECGIGFSRSDGNGVFSGCSNSNFVFQLSPIAYTTGTSALSPRDTSLITLNNVAPVVNDVTYTSYQSCNGVSNCDGLTINGPTNYCSTDPAIYRGIRNPGCYAAVKWQLNGGNATIQQYSDSTIAVQFLQSGTYTLIAGLGTSCQQVNDTITINVADPGQVLDIGPPDSLLCSGNTIVLNAHSGYTSYQWQDGSTDSTFLVNAPGRYYVTVVSPCGQTFSDTINITPSPPIPFDIGPDRTKCNNDTLHINATTGFFNYNWGPDYNINSLTGQSVIVQPAMDTIYYVKAEKNPGCFSYDTVRITVKTSLPINLGTDKSFCQGDSAVLDAGAGFNQYLWSNGSTSVQLVVFDAGTYSVTGISSNGCKSYDTLLLLNVFSLPASFLPMDMAFCQDSVLQIHSLRSFNNYQWNTGSTLSNIAVSQPGIYWLMVGDNNNCKGRDTIVISLKDCTKGIYFPSAFTPNNDGKNDKYKPLVYGRLTSYSFVIYNRWGQVVFNTNSVNDAWNGTYKGLQQDSDIFIWICNYRLEGEENRNKKGTFLLIR